MEEKRTVYVTLDTLAERRAAQQEKDRRGALEKDVNATVKLILSEVELAARTPPVEALHPYEVDARRKRVIRALWLLYKRCTGED
jgi:hypothetical protein